MISSERSERAEIFVLWRRKHILHNYIYRPKTQDKAINDCEQGKKNVCVSETYTILLNILLVNHIICRYNVPLCS